MTVNWGNDGRLASRRLYKTSGGANLSLLTYAYDNDDNITGITDGVNATNNVSYAYDVRGRLSRVTAAATSAAPYKRTDWLYDANGNRTVVERRTAANDTIAAQTDSYTRTAGTNRLASITAPAGTRSFTPDGRGNTLSETRPGGIAVTAGYDGHGRLTSYAQSGSVSLIHVYNGLGDRIASTATPAGGIANTRRFVTAPDGRVLGEYGSSATDVKAEFIWLSPVVGDTGPFGGDDGLGGYMPIALATAAPGGGTTLSWVHGDHLGTPIVMTDATGIAIAQPSGYSATAFPGQSKTLADLYYNRYRDYDPTTGRYIQADPIGLAGGANPYLYAMANPVRYVDPTGEFVPAAILGGAVLGVGIELGVQAFDNWRTGRNNRWQDIFDQNCYEWGEVAVAGGMGALGGSWVKGLVRLSPGSMVFNNVSRRIRRAEDLINQPIDLHHWAIPRRWGLPERFVNRPWNLNPVPRNFHQDVLNPMGWPRAAINGAPWQIQAGVGLGLVGVGGEMLDGDWE